MESAFFIFLQSSYSSFYSYPHPQEFLSERTISPASRNVLIFAVSPTTGPGGEPGARDLRISALSNLGGGKGASFKYRLYKNRSLFFFERSWNSRRRCKTSRKPISWRAFAPVTIYGSPSHRKVSSSLLCPIQTFSSIVLISFRWRT